MLKKINVKNAVGTRLAHDITEIRPGEFKGPAFRKGHEVCNEDICHLQKLGKSTTDARDLHELLATNGYERAHMSLILDEDATKSAISDRLDWLARRAGPNDTVLIFFSGHGAQRIGGFPQVLYQAVDPGRQIRPE